MDLVHSASRLRCSIAESLGSDRYSRPALNDLDRKLSRYLPDDGVFVEAGANDGYRFSNTYYLERCKGWDGVLIEPVPELAARARRYRRAPVVNAALVAPDYPEEAITLDASGMTTVVLAIKPDHHVQDFATVERQVTVPARTLSDVLDEHRITPTFLSLDIEGYEPQALAGLDLSRHAPDWMLIEARDGCEPVDAVIGARYEAVQQLSAFDYLYRIRADAKQALARSSSRSS